MTAVSCVVCQADTDAFLCTHCTAELERALGELPALLTDLEVTATRQDRGTGTALYAMRRTRLWHEALTATTDATDVPPALRSRDGHKTLPTTPWPFSWDAANLAWTVRNTLGTWQQHLTETRGIEHGDLVVGGVAGPACQWCTHESCAQIGVNPHRRRDVRICAWLMRNIDAIRLDEAAGEIHDSITGDRLDVLRAIDRQDPDAYYGRCDMPDVRVDIHGDGILVPLVGICGAELLGHLGEDEVKCGSCGAVYDVKTRRQYLVESVDDEWARPHVIANALTSLDEPVRPDTLRKWIERDAELVEQRRTPRYPLVLQVGVDDGGHALYRVGDVRARIAAMKERREMMSA